MRRAVLISAMSLVVAACGGAADPVGDDIEVTTTLSAETNQGDDEPQTSTTSAGVGSGVSMASVTIGGDTYEFRSTGFLADTCNPNVFGLFHVVLSMADENGEMLFVDDKSSTLAIAIPPEGVDVLPTVEMSVVAADMDWFANPERS